MSRYTRRRPDGGGRTEGAEMIRVIYISGVGRSGSTLLDRMLGALPGVYPLGEVADLWSRFGRTDDCCACGVAYRACDFWTEVGERAYGGWHQADLDRMVTLRRLVPRIRRIPWFARHRLTGPLLPLFEEYVRHYARVYRAVTELTGAHTIVDSSKYSMVGLCLGRSPAFDLRVVHLVRDPRGVAYSWTKHLANGMHMMPRYPPSTTAWQWNLQNGITGLLGATGPAASRAAHRVPVLRVHYEQLLADPRGTLGRIAGFTDLRVDADQLSHLDRGHAELRAVHRVGGNPMRFSAGRVALRGDDAWRTALPPRQRRLVSALCAPLLVRYGYPLRAGGSAAPRLLGQRQD